MFLSQPASFVSERLETLPAPARKLFDLIIKAAYGGPLRSKPPGTATPPEILEACGLSVEEFYALLDTLKDAGLIRISNTYPFEEIALSSEASAALGKFDHFEVPPDQRFLEDYVAGRVYEFGSATVTEAEIIDFATRYDPQYFHVDPGKAAASEFGGIIASGWHTMSLLMRLLVDHFLPRAASLASPGVDEVRWPNPLRPGDTIRLRVTILESRPSRSKPDRGIVRSRMEAINQKDQVVLSLIGVSILRRR